MSLTGRIARAPPQRHDGGMERSRTSSVRSPRLMWLAACVVCVLFWVAVVYYLFLR